MREHANTEGKKPRGRELEGRRQTLCHNSEILKDSEGGGLSCVGPGPFVTSMWVIERLLSASLSLMHCPSHPSAALIKMHRLQRQGWRSQRSGQQTRAEAALLSPCCSATANGPKGHASVTPQPCLIYLAFYLSQRGWGRRGQREVLWLICPF